MRTFKEFDLRNELAKVEVSIPISAIIAEQLLLMNSTGFGSFFIRVEDFQNDGATLVLKKFIRANRSEYELDDDEEDYDQEYDMRLDAYDFGDAIPEYNFSKRPF